MKELLPGAFVRTVRVCLAVATLVVSAAAAHAQPITSNVGSHLGTYTVGEVNFGLSASGGSGGPYTWTLQSGSLPTGVALRTDLQPWMGGFQAALWGIATTPGDYSFTLRASDGTTSTDFPTQWRITAFTATQPFELPDAYEGVSYSYQLTTQGAAGAVTYTATSVLPAGITLSGSGLLEVNGTAAGVYNIQYSATDGSDTVFRNFNIRVSALRFTTLVLPNATQGTSYSASVAVTGGSGSYAFTDNGGLPFGLSMNGAGQITGTVNTSPGKYSFSVTATDTVQPTLSYTRNHVIVVIGQPKTLPAIIPYGSQFTDCTVHSECTLGVHVNSGGVPPFTWTASGLPPGLTIGTGTTWWVSPLDGEIRGFATAAGNFNVTITVTDGDGATATNTFPLRVSPLAARPDGGQVGTIGVPLTLPLRVIGGTPFSSGAPYTVSLVSGRLPQGMSLDAGTLSLTGTPTENGHFNVVIEALDSTGADLRTNVGFSIGGAGPMIGDHWDLGTSSVGSSYSRQLFACCSAGPYTWSVIGGSMPPEMSITPAGVLSAASLNTPGTFTFLVQVQDAATNVGATQFTIRVSPLSTPFFDLGFGNVGTPYSFTLTANGAVGAVTWTLEPLSYLPPGIQIVSNAGTWTLAGTPTHSGQFNFSLRVTDANGNAAVRSVSLPIYPAGVTPPVAFFEGGNLGTWSIGEINYGLAPTGGNGSYSWSVVSGALPPGLAIRTAPFLPPWFHSGQKAGIIGVATVPGNYSFRLRVTSGPGSFERDFTIRITGLTIDGNFDLPDGFVGHPYSRQLTAGGNAGSVTWSAISLPPGMSLSPAGVLSGSSLVAGFHGVTVAANDGTDTVTRTFNLAVFSVRITTSSFLPDAIQGTAYSTTIAATVDGAPCPACTFSASFLPNNFSLSPDGTLTITANAFSGRTSFDVTATTPGNVSYVKRMAVVVVPTNLSLPSVSAFLDDCTFGVPCSRNAFFNGGGAPPYTWSASGLPPGMTLVSAIDELSRFTTPGDVMLVGTPRQLGTFNVTLTVEDANGGIASQTFPLRVSALLSRDFFFTGDRGVPYSSRIRILGGVPEYTATIVSGRLPAGLSLDAATQLISGTPQENGFFNFTLDVVDSDAPANPLRVSHSINIGGGTSTISINSSDLPSGLIGSNYSASVSACCLPNGFTWTIIGGSLPLNLQLNSATGQISGTIDPSNAPGVYTLRFKAAHPQDPNNFGIRDVSLRLTALSITTPGNSFLPDANVGVAFPATQFVASGATAAATWSVAAGSLLPPGLTLSSTGLLGGTPSAPGQFSFSIAVTEGDSLATRTYTVSIYPNGTTRPLGLVNIGPFTGERGVFTRGITSSNVIGGMAPFTFSLTPSTPQIPGMRMLDDPPFPSFFSAPSTLAVYGGVIAEPGVYTPSIRVTDALGQTFDRTVTVTVTGMATLTQSTLPRATRNVAYFHQLEVVGGSGNYLWSSSSLPSGISLNPATGVLSGTPTVSGTFFPSFTVTDQTAGGSITTNPTLPINHFAITTNAALPAGKVGVAYSQTLTANCGGPCSWFFSGSGTPPLSLNPSTGVLSGTPGTTFSGTFSVTANGTGGSATQVFSLVITSDTFPVLAMTHAPFSDVTVGSMVSNQLTAQGGAPPYTWTLDDSDPGPAGDLPPGVSLISSGATVSGSLGPVAYLAGKVLVPGVYTFTLRVTDSLGATTTQTYNWNVSRLSLQTTSLPLSGGAPLNFNQPYSQQLLVLGGNTPYTNWSALTALPPGLTLDPNTGVVGGSPTNTGTFSGTRIQITDGDGNQVSGGVTFSVSGGGSLSFPNGSLGTVQIGSTVTFNVAPSGPGPITVTELTPLPPGFVLSSSATPFVGGSAGSLQLFGQPTTAGTFSFTLRADSPTGGTAVRTFTFNVTPYTVPGNLLTLPDAIVGAPYSQPLVAYTTNGPITWTLAPTSQMPAGLSLSSAGLVSGSPAQAGLYGFAVDLVDASGLTIRRSYQLNVSAVALTDNAVLPNATVGVLYSHTFSGAGPGVFWTSSGLPAGFTLDANTGELTGTATARTSFTFTITANDGVRPISRRFTLYTRLPIQPMLDVVPSIPDLGDAVVGQQITFSLNGNGGVPPYSWSLAPGSSLPAGLALYTSGVQFSLSPGSVAIGGTPSTAGNYAFDLLVTDAAGTVARRTYTLRVTPLAILGQAPPTVIAGTPYTARFAAVGGTGITFTVAPTDNGISNPLPPGLSLAANGTLSGTTTSTGSYPFILIAQDGGGNQVRKQYSLTVNNAAVNGIRVTNGAVFQRAVGGGFTLRLTTSAPAATNFTWSVTAGSLPPGVVLATGLSPVTFPNSTWLAGRATAAGTYTFTLRATQDGTVPAVFAEKAFTLRIAPMQFVSPAWELFNVLDVPPARVGDPYSFTFKVAGGQAPYTFAPSPFDPLPAGLSLSAGGVLSGTPSSGATGNYFISVLATDANGETGIIDGVTLTVSPAGTAAPLLRTGNPLPASVGVPYGFALDHMLRGGTGPFAWSVAAGHSLPAGLTIVPGSNGVPSYLTGTPTTASATPVTFTLDVTDSSSPAQTIQVAVSMRVVALALSPDALPTGQVGVPYFASFTPAGGVSPYIIQLAASSSLPPGVSFVGGGVLFGTPSSPGNFTVQVLVTDATNTTFSKIYVLTVDNAAGQAPALSLSPKPIAVYYEIGSPNPAPIPVSVSSTSGALPFNAFLGNVPGSLSASGGTTPTSINLTLNPTGLPAGTYSGLIAASAAGAVNRGDWTPVTLTVAPAPPCTYAVAPSAGSKEAAGGSGSFSVSTGYACAWSATSSASWLHVTGGGSGVGSGTVSFSADSNLGVNTPSRTATITVNGAVYTLTQFGTDALNCSFVINPGAVAATSAGGSATVNVTASNALCAWTATSATMGLSSGGGTGNGSVLVTVPSFGDPGSRVLTATIAGHTFSVTQSGIDCTVTLSPYTAAVPFEGVATGQVDVSTPASCGYSTVLGPSWLQVTSGASGTGPTALQYSVEENTTTVARVGTLTIGGQAFTVTQAARPCTVTVNTAGLGSPYGSGSANGSIGVTANGANCAWSASSSVPWASVAPSTGSGNGTVNVFISSNAASTVARAGSITVAGQTINISQAGTACSFALETATGAAPAVGGTGSVRVLSPSACAWSATSNDGWLSIVSSGGSGTSDVQFAASANPSATERIGTLTIAGLTYTVTQAGAPCTYTIDGGTTSPLLANQSVANQSFSFTAGFPGCAPAAVSYASWITVDNTSFGGSAGTVTYSVQPNPNGAMRTGSIVVGNAVFTVRQAGSPCAFSLNAYGRIFNAAGGDETVHGSPTAVGCTPDVGTDQPSFIQLFPLTGPVFDVFSLPYQVAPFPASLTTGVRFARITFGGQIVLIKQFSW